MKNKLIPREVLFGNPVNTNPKISPDGSKMAYLAPYEGVLNIWFGDIVSENFKILTKDSDRGVTNYFWSQNSNNIIYLQDKGGNENWRLYDINIDTLETRDLTPFEDVQVQVIEHSKHFPNDLIIGMNKDNPNVHDVYNLNLLTGELKKVAKNPGNIAGWLTDFNLKVLGAIEANETGGFDLLIRNSEKSKFEKKLTWGMEDSLTSSPIMFSKDGNSVLLRDSKGANSSKLVSYDLKTEKITVIAEDEKYDVSNVMVHPDTYEIQMVSFTKARNENIIIDHGIDSDIDYISKLSEGDYFIYDRDDSDQIWLVGFTEDNGPVSFYLYNRTEKSSKLLFYNKPELKNYDLAHMEPISFKSRDGLDIHGYITFPKGLEKKNLPMVLNVHGGPWARDTWGYNSEAQWLSNRGYICLQVNFRGSTGYGKHFLNAGDREWGAKMHDDLLDAVKWASDQNYINPDKVAIYGGSYGGYAALVGATFTPESFCCAVSVVGPSNLITLINTIPAYWSTFLANFKNRVGDPETEEEFLKSRSPLFKVDNIKVPMLIGQGANDPRVKQSESEQIVEAMKEKNIDHQYLLYEDEGHGFVKPNNRIDFYTHAEKFFAKHLGGIYEE